MLLHYVSSFLECLLLIFKIFYFIAVVFINWHNIGLQRDSHTLNRFLLKDATPWLLLRLNHRQI